MKPSSWLQSQHLLLICTSAFLMHCLWAWKHLKLTSRAFEREEGRKSRGHPLIVLFASCCWKLPAFTITAMTMTTRKVPLPVSGGKQNHSLFEERILPAHTLLPTHLTLHGLENTIRSTFVRPQLKFWWQLNLWKWNNQLHLLDGTWKIHLLIWVGLFLVHKFTHGA